MGKSCSSCGSILVSGNGLFLPRAEGQVHITLMASVKEISANGTDTSTQYKESDVTFVVVEVVSLQVSRSSICRSGQALPENKLGDQVERVTAICPPTSTWIMHSA